MLLRLTGSLCERPPLFCGFILSAENSNSSVETIRSSELNWEDEVEVYFGSKLHQNVVEFSTRGARHVECTEHYSQSGCQKEFLALRRDLNHRHSRGNGSQRWKGTQKTLHVNPKIGSLFTHNNSIMANKGNRDSHGSSYCNLEE